MNQQSIPELKQEKSSQIEESTLSLRPNNSLQLKRWQIVLASLIILLTGVGIGKLEPNKTQTQTATATKIKPLPVQTTKVQLAKSY
ncbi:MAG: hypothetical protein ACRDBG_26870, partial [Waterburya sp.]